MPVFFNPKNLTDAQRANWDAAIAAYARVLSGNQSHMNTCLASEPRIPGGDIMRASKSALFARLLEGRDALPYPPPTSYAYPWYAVIEEPGPHQVRIDGGMDGNTVWLDRCDWIISHMNDAAKDLLALDRATSCGQWNSSLFAQIKAAYAKGPELLVHFGNWPAYRLFAAACQHTNTRASRPYAEDVVRMGVRPQNLTRSVFDLDELMLNARLDVCPTEHQPSEGPGEWVDLFFDRWHLEKLG